MSSYFLDRVRVQTATTGQTTSITLNSTAFSPAFLNMADAGAVDQRKYTYIIEDGNDFEVQESQVFTLATRVFARGTPSLSVISGVVGTTKLTLSGSAIVRVIVSAIDLENFFKARNLRTVTGSTDTLLDDDGLVVYNRASALAVTLPQAGASSLFQSRWWARVFNIGAGDVTITPTTSTVNGAATLVLKQYESAVIMSDGTNYQAAITTRPFYVSQTLGSSEKSAARANIGADFPSGTIMLFKQTSAPTGWTKDTTTNNNALRVVSGTPSTGGSVDFSTLFGRTATDSKTLVAGNIPALSVDINTFRKAIGVPLQNADVAASGGFWAGGSDYQVQATGTYTVNAGSASSFTMGIDMRVKYTDVILASKD